MNLVERLKALDSFGYKNTTGAIGNEAADRIEALEAELEAATNGISAWKQDYYFTVEQMNKQLASAQKQREDLIALLEQAARALESGVQYAQDYHDEPPYPQSKWDYEAYQLSGEIDAALASVKGDA